MDVYTCHPKKPEVGPAEAASLSDAECANHPGKKAVAVCVGSGDYICSLCRVEVDGKDYSVQYIDRHGGTTLPASFTATLSRPDHTICLIGLAGTVVPFFLLLGGIVATVFLVRHVRMRRTDAIYRTVCMRVWPWLCWMYLIVFGLIGIIVVAGFFDSRIGIL